MSHHVDLDVGKFVSFKSTSGVVFVEGLVSIELSLTTWEKFLLIKEGDF